MISLLSERITRLLCKKEIIKEDEKDIYQYGYEVFISSLISFLIVATVGIFAGLIIESAIFYIVFVFTRQYCGGYHANTYLKCNIIFTSIYLSILFFSEILIDFFNLLYVIIFLAFYLAAIIEFTPIESENKRLSKAVRKKTRTISIATSCVFSVFSLITYFVFPKISMIIILTLFTVAMLMVIENSKQRGCQL